MFNLILKIVQKVTQKFMRHIITLCFTEKNKEKSREFQTTPSMAKKYNPHRSLVKTAA